jgi:transcriptional regulator
MYVPTHFQINDASELHRIMTNYPLGVLITTNAGLDANHLPFLFDANEGELGVLTAHVARANPVWEQLANGSEVLVIFRGEESYISPNWYPSKHETHRQVPTWNYEVVHAHGRMTVHDDEKFLRGVVGRLTKTHEAMEPKPWKMSDAPQDYMDAMLNAIVGIQITITRLEGKAKLSQNREPRDLHGAVEALTSLGKNGLADNMKRQLNR